MTDSTTPAPKRTRKPKAAPVQEAEIIETVAAPDLTAPTSRGQIAPLGTVGSQLSSNFNVDPKKVDDLARTINVKDTNSIITFGTGSQKQIGAVTDQMLQGVRNKDLGPISSDMTNMVVSLKKMDFAALQGNSKVPGFLKKILGLGTSLAKFQAQFDSVQDSVAKAEANLQSHRIGLLQDIKMLDVLYARTDEHLDDLEAYILAAERVLEELNTRTIPEAKIKADTSGDMADVQELRDITNARDSLERKIHDLQLTRQITIQALPSIRQVQQNDQAMAEQIQGQILTTLPLWKQQMVLAVSAHRGREAAKASKQATDYTNTLVVKTAEQVRLGNKETREQIERGIVDVASVRKANQEFISMLEESLQLAEQGKAMRAAAEAEMLKGEAELKKALTASVERQTALPAR